jgi:hypothetical protein
MSTLEQLYKPNLRGPLRTTIGQADAWAGRTTVASGSASQTVSSTNINSDSIVRYGVQVGSAAINSGGAMVVNSIVSGVSFAFANQGGVAIAWDNIVMWEIVKTS